MTEALEAGCAVKGALEGLTEGYAGVFCGVVVVDYEIVSVELSFLYSHDLSHTV